MNAGAFDHSDLSRILPIVYHPMSNSAIRRIHLLGFVDEVRHIHENMPTAGSASCSGRCFEASGIPTAGELGLAW